MSDKPTPPASVAGTELQGEDIAISSQLLTRILAIQRRLQSDDEIAGLLEFLLTDLPDSLGLQGAELLLLDADGDIARMLPETLTRHRGLTLSNDSIALRSLHRAPLDVDILSFADDRMFRVLPWNPAANGAVLLPLQDEGRLIGSYHLGLEQDRATDGPAVRRLWQSLMHGAELALQRALQRRRTDDLMLVDAQSGVGNRRAFQRVLSREIARARRTQQPLSLLALKVDRLDDLYRDYGDSARRFIMRRLAQRVASCLRETDHISRTGEDCFGLLLPACSEPHGHDIGERLCADIRDFAIDDGRGGVLYTTLSIGVVSWDPATLPSDSREWLIALFESEAASALAKTARRGGDGVSISRLGALMT